MTPLRWIHDSPADGPSNMARDEMLLLRVGRGESPPTLRFYRWEPATLSLGYFQPYEEYGSLQGPAGDLPVVRRLTGGGAILHDREITYSLTLPLKHPLLQNNDPKALYEHVHKAFAAVLTELGVPVTPGPPNAAGSSQRGPFFCFERHSSFDLLAGGEKLMGSAQRRTVHAVLQHGSLILDSRFNQQHCTALTAYTDADFNAYLPRVAELIADDAATDAGFVTPEEREEEAILRDKYASDAWTLNRCAPECIG